MDDNISMIENLDRLSIHMRKFFDYDSGKEESGDGDEEEDEKDDEKDDENSIEEDIILHLALFEDKINSIKKNRMKLCIKNSLCNCISICNCYVDLPVKIININALMGSNCNYHIDVTLEKCISSIIKKWNQKWGQKPTLIYYIMENELWKPLIEIIIEINTIILYSEGNNMDEKNKREERKRVEIEYDLNDELYIKNNTIQMKFNYMNYNFDI